MGRADAALVLAHYAVLRVRYSRISTQQHLGRYQCMACIFMSEVLIGLILS